MFRLIGQLYNRILQACVILAGLLIVVGISLVIIDVAMRSLGMKPPGYTVAFVEYILLYFVLLAAPYLVREKGHVLTDIVQANLPDGLRRAVEKIVYVICITISLIFAYMGAFLFEEAWRFGYMDERSVDIPYWALYALFPLCFTLIAIEFARYLLGFDSLYDREQQLDSM